MFKRLRRFIPPLAYIDILHEALAEEMDVAVKAYGRADSLEDELRQQVWETQSLKRKIPQLNLDINKLEENAKDFSELVDAANDHINTIQPIANKAADYEAKWRGAEAEINKINISLRATEKENAYLGKENDRLLAFLADPELLAIEIKSTIEGHLADVTMKHWASKLLASSFADSFNSAGATNFVELSLGDDEYGHWIVTIQKRDKKSPYDMMADYKHDVEMLGSFIRELLEILPENYHPYFNDKARTLLNPTPNKD